MRFVTVRELRNTSGQVWRRLGKEEMVLTANGKPVGVLVGVDEGNLEATLRELRRARAAAAVSRMREDAARAGRDRLTPAQNEAEIQAARRRQA
jgi:antitoxin (DNA-binding transcriptional repressor) of toxin-antitoxin stability system